MENNVKASARFSATNGKERYEILLELIPSGSFQYGNGNALVLTVYVDGKQVTEQCFDARYDNRFYSVRSFNENALQFVRDFVRPDLEVRPLLKL